DTHRDGTAVTPDGGALSFDAPNEGNVIGTGWNGFTHVIAGGDGVLYAVEPNGDLLWYRDTHRDGTPVTPDGVAASFDAPNEGNVVIKSGWYPEQFSHLLSGGVSGGGIIYAIDDSWNIVGARSTSLTFFKDLAQDGTARW